MLWFRNTWVWHSNPPHSNPAQKPLLHVSSSGELQADHDSLGAFLLSLDGTPELLFTNNETNTERIWNWRGENTFYKDAFHQHLI
jgi:hypothetical protein